MFDSDKKNIGEQTERTDKIAYFKGKTIKTLQPQDYEYNTTDLIVWHVLYKRSIENYIPLNILLDELRLNNVTLTEQQKTDLSSKTEDDLDFIEYNGNNIKIGGSEIKSLFPEIFLKPSFSCREMEQRCEHHKIHLPEAGESVSEIEQILLKIAKIV